MKLQKDLCDICVAHTNGNLPDENWAAQRRKKDACQGEKEKYKNNPNLKYIFTLDLQAILVCPQMQASVLYYQTKLSVPNFTIYNLKLKDKFCFLWNEAEGGLTANEFTTVICNFIKDLNVEKD